MKHKCDGCQYKGDHQEMMFRPFGVCLKETTLEKAEAAFNADVCPQKKTDQMTEADMMKALWSCLASREYGWCDNRECPYFNKSAKYTECQKMLCADIQNLLNRKNAEIEEKELIIKQTKHATKCAIEAMTVEGQLLIEKKQRD